MGGLASSRLTRCPSAVLSVWVDVPGDVKAEEYEALYRTLTLDWEAPLCWRHFKVEGQVEFSCVLFIPRRAPLPLQPGGRQRNLRLYVRRVFVTDDCSDFCPSWLSFVRGLVDSEDLPLSISRQSLHVSRLLQLIRKHVVSKAIDCMAEQQADAARYAALYSAYSAQLKLGLHDEQDAGIRQSLAELLRFPSSRTQPQQLTSLSEYVQRMRPGQRHIFFLTAESEEAARHARSGRRWTSGSSSCCS